MGRLSSALDRARAGVPTVLVIQGGAGLGKTALLTDLIAQARDFRAIRADGLEHDRAPFTLLWQWGVEPSRPSDGGEASARSAALALRDRIDRMSLSGPVLLVADDLHWADPESVEALLWLLRRTSGDRLLVAVGTRPLPGDLHGGLRRWIAGRDAGVVIALRGLTVDGVAQLARARWPELSDELAHRLHEHTAGNPLYLTTLLAERELSELSTAGMLPAPAVFARSIALRAARLSEGAVGLLRAVCVLGSSWAPLALAARVSIAAGIGSPATFAQELLEAGLVDVRQGDGPAELRPAHALIRASVYELILLPLRGELHRRAGELVGSRASALQHRMAAAGQYDDALAGEMAVYAASLYGQRSFRQAGLYLRWASGLTADPGARERRWLESLFDVVLSFDFVAAATELGDVEVADDAVWRALVLGLYAIWRRSYRDGVGHLEPISVTPLDSVEPRARYRVEVLLAWARLCLGHPTEVIAAGLARAAAVRTMDAGLSGLEVVTDSQISIRLRGHRPVYEQLCALPAAAAVPLAATGALAFRGTLRATIGLTREANDDLAEATRRIIGGVTDLGAGSFHAMLGLVQWLTGDWGRARVSFRQALDIGGAFVHQMTAALAPLVDIGVGRFSEADARIAATRELLTESPWHEACQTFVGTLLVRAHAGGSPAEQRSALAVLRGTPFEVGDLTRASPTLLLNYVPALIWARRLDEAEVAVARFGQIEPTANWAAGVSSWYRGLISEARGDPSTALAHLGAALAEDLELPLYRAHLLTDHARLARLLRHPGVDGSLREAEQIYDGLGADPYLRRAQAMRSTVPEPAATLPGGVGLTEREQEVLTLVVIGMSYAQISRELFITQSTVGYHLGNIYGKAGVSSRHRLSEMARANPRAFGITLRPS